jgi:hypothetical protein
MHVLK